MALKFIDDPALNQKMPLAVTDVALDLSEVTEKHRPLHALPYPLGRGSGKRSRHKDKPQARRPPNIDAVTKIRIEIAWAEHLEAHNDRTEDKCHQIDNGTK